MTLLQIYFVIAGIILLVKFLFSVFTLKWLKKFFNDNKSEILSRINEPLPFLSYGDLIIYHFSTKSIKYSEYEKEMSSFVVLGNNCEIMVFIIFALTWVFSVPIVLLYMLYNWLENIFEIASKSFLS